MLLRSPKFWYAEKVNWFLKILLFLPSRAYSWGSSLNYRRSYKNKSVPQKVIAIGAITAGGSGKSIVVKALADLLGILGKKCAVLSVGYGRSSSRVLAVDLDMHTCADVGDEPLMLSQKGLDVFVAKNRSQSAALANSKGIYDVFLLDDGICQKYLRPDVRFLVIDADQGFGNGEMLPLGPNRLSMKTIKNDIDAAILLTYQSEYDFSKIREKIPDSIPILMGRLLQNFSQINCGERFLAFCGIGYPKKFFDSIAGKLTVVKQVVFPDHYPFSDAEIVDLLDDARFLDAKLLTTEKDLARIPKRYHHLITTVPVRISWYDNEKIASYLR
ncbi:MAG: tetraacyldisaccharide 4'-kinase [Holosporaceae bacterium]|nr:tetraacyldisaccharide 4'-kinase [Holosporaceae bacterium]